eukprot:scaffold14824_cov83-Isochrysis_galbana.AAC.2
MPPVASAHAHVRASCSSTPSAGTPNQVRRELGRAREAVGRWVPVSAARILIAILWHSPHTRRPSRRLGADDAYYCSACGRTTQ